MSASYLADLADALLAAAQAGLAEARTGHPPPDRTFVSHGVPADDLACPGNGMLTVHAGRAPGGQLGALHHVGFSTPTAMPARVPLQVIYSLIVTLKRCYPVGQIGAPIPEAADVTEAAEALLTDLWCLATKLYELRDAETLFAAHSAQQVGIGDAIVVDPMGGPAGFTLSVVVNLSEPGP